MPETPTQQRPAEAAHRLHCDDHALLQLSGCPQALEAWPAAALREAAPVAAHVMCADAQEVTEAYKRWRGAWLHMRTCCA
jgi:hypothetical protein